MRRVLTFVFVMVALNSYAQLNNSHTNGIVTDSIMRNAFEDTSITVVYVKKPVAGPKATSNVAYFINGKFSPGLGRINPDRIKSLRVGKRDTIIAGKKYSGMIFIKLKNYTNKYIPKMITLNDLKEKYTTLKNQPALFTIDGKLINANYNLYQVDKNTIFKIFVEKFAGTENNNDTWLVKLLTKTKENIRRSKIIMLRGTSGLVKN